MKLSGELLPGLFEKRLDSPVLYRLERADLALSFHQQAQSDGLHAPGRNSFLDGLPEDRTRLVSDETVEDASRLLRVDFPLVDLSRVRDRELHGIATHLVKDDAS